MQSTDNQSILRLLISLVLVTTAMTFYAGIHLERTLPEPLYAFVHAQANGNISTSQAASALLVFAFVALAVTGMVGLWWCRRWGRLAFTVGSLALPVVVVVQAITDPAALITNAVESGANMASNMAIGATLAMIWLGMEAEFSEQPAHGPRGVT
ncbi:MAG TPA: hypothetical protein VGG01_00950 [Xanthobacteraceae bacterium]